MRPSSTVELSAGTVFAGFRIERPLGCGGMGIVYLARELELDRLVGLKVIRGELAEDERFRDRFRSESRKAASIDHPRVVTVFRAGEREGLHYVAMQYVPGRDLQRLISIGGAVGPEEATTIVAQIADGLDAVHKAGLVHRDVKPANMIVADEEPGNPAAYLTDFGLAKVVASRSRLTATGEVIGTVDYMAPEQIEAGPVDARTDVYALGCVLFHAVTGEVPFGERESSAKMWAHLNEPPPSPGSRGPHRLAVLDPVIRRAMAKEPGKRFPSAGDLGRAAVAAVRGEAVTESERSVGAGEAAAAETVRLPTESRPPRTEPLPRPRRRRRRRGRWLAVALMVFALAGLGAAAFIAVPRLSDTGSPGTAATGVEVPNLVGEPLDVAEQELHDLGLRSSRVGGGLFGVLVPAEWEVCDTSPRANSTAPPGSTVRLLIDRPEVC
jgi:serine/threonine protein kinase